MAEKGIARLTAAGQESGPLLYRYFSLQYGLEALQTGYWKVGRIAELNDPFDCRPQITHVPAGTPGGVEFPKQYLSTMMSNFGLLCFSEVINDPVIWSHYAECHRGIALGFDIHRNYNGVLQVTYGSIPPALNMGILASLMQPYAQRENELHIFQQGFTKKAPSWSYEKEWRQFIKLDECTMHGVHYFQSLPASALREVVLGAKCPMEMLDVERIVRKLPGRRRGVRVKKCRMIEASYEFDFDLFPQNAR